MKTLKFAPELVELILKGEKISTWRLFDDKDLTLDDELEMVNKETLEKFGEATITSLRVKTLGTLEDKDWEGHNRYESEEAIYADFRKYYGDSVGPDTEVKIIGFEFRSL